MNSQKIALRVKNLSVSFNGQKVIDDLNFEVPKGETLVILGPNGAGKTTLLRALLGLIDYEGEVDWAVKNVSYLPPNELLQRKGLLPLTVSDFFGLKSVSEKKALRSLDTVGLDGDIYSKRIANLSTGQFQRMTIAWSLVDDPDTLLFDEPTSGIDVGGTETIYSLLHNYWKHHDLTIILVTHELNVVWEHADNVLCLNKKSVCYGAPAKALTTEKLTELYGAGIKFHGHIK